MRRTRPPRPRPPRQPNHKLPPACSSLPAPSHHPHGPRTSAPGFRKGASGTSRRLLVVKYTLFWHQRANRVTDGRNDVTDVVAFTAPTMACHSEMREPLLCVNRDPSNCATILPLWGRGGRTGPIWAPAATGEREGGGVTQSTGVWARTVRPLRGAPGPHTPAPHHAQPHQQNEKAPVATAAHAPGRAAAAQAFPAQLVCRGHGKGGGGRATLNFGPLSPASKRGAKAPRPRKRLPATQGKGRHAGRGNPGWRQPRGRQARGEWPTHCNVRCMWQNPSAPRGRKPLGEPQGQ